MVAPVYTQLFPTDLTALWDQVQAIWNTYKGLIDRAGTEVEKAYLYVHFYRSAKTLFDSRAFLGLPGVDTLKGNLENLVNAPLRALTGAIPVLKGCAGDLDRVVSCAATALMTLDQAVKAKGEVEKLTGGSPRTSP